MPWWPVWAIKYHGTEKKRWCLNHQWHSQANTITYFSMLCARWICSASWWLGLLLLWPWVVYDSLSKLVGKIAIKWGWRLRKHRMPCVSTWSDSLLVCNNLYWRTAMTGVCLAVNRFMLPAAIRLLSWLAWVSACVQYKIPIPSQQVSSRRNRYQPHQTH